MPLYWNAANFQDGTTTWTPTEFDWGNTTVRPIQGTVTWNTTSTVTLTNNAFQTTDNGWTYWGTPSAAAFGAVGDGVTDDTAAIEAREEYLRDLRERGDTRAEERRAAIARARELLLSCLDEAQARELDERRLFTVRLGQGRTFQIHHGRAGNVYELDENGRAMRRYCIHPNDGSPDEDAMLAQKLMLETDLPRFEHVANVTPLAA